MKLVKIIAFGLLGYVFLFLPVLLGVFVYWLCRHVGLSSFASKVVGTTFLSMIPMGLMGHALLKARQEKLKPKTALPTTDSKANRELPDEKYERIIDIWKTSLEVQQHFNSLELQIRNFAVTLLVAVLGATAFALKEHYVITVFGSSFSLAVAICLAGVPGLLGFYFIWIGTGTIAS